MIFTFVKILFYTHCISRKPIKILKKVCREMVGCNAPIVAADFWVRIHPDISQNSGNGRVEYISPTKNGEGEEGR
jgi:hypothetical protein